MQEQAVDREHERDVFQQEIQKLEQQLKMPQRHQPVNEHQSNEVKCCYSRGHPFVGIGKAIGGLHLALPRPATDKELTLCLLRGEMAAISLLAGEEIAFYVVL